MSLLIPMTGLKFFADAPIARNSTTAVRSNGERQIRQYGPYLEHDEEMIGLQFKANRNYWGPKNENPPRMLGFRKGDSTITVTRYVDDGRYPISVEMMERIARTIAARL